MTEATEGKGKTSWWQTVPGILTGAAAVITAVAGLVGALYQNGLLGKGAALTAGRPSPASASAGSETTVRAGHHAFRLLDAKTEPYAGGSGGGAKKLLRLSVRVTDVAGIADYVDRKTIRLAVEGAELLPDNAINVAVYDRQAVDTEALFVIPAGADQVQVLFGREDAVGRLALALHK